MQFNGNYQPTQNGNKTQIIDTSLNMLKQLQAKLKKNEEGNNHANFAKLQTSKQSHKNYTHTRMRTQPYSFTQRHHNIGQPETSQFTITQKSQQSHLPHKYHEAVAPQTYSHSQPTMIEHNQNDYGSIKDILKQNRKLKKYVNCLLMMNDYLKNQLIKKDQYYRKGVQDKMGHSFQLQLMRMEVEYLKQLNKDKQLQIKKSMHLGHAVQLNQHNSKNKQKHKKSQSVHIGQMIKNRTSNLGYQQHNRCSSAYEFEPNTQHHHNYQRQYDYIGNSKLKTIKAKKINQNTQYKNQSKKNSHDLANDKQPKKVVNHNKNNKANKSSKKCRLCYI